MSSNPTEEPVKVEMQGDTIHISFDLEPFIIKNNDVPGCSLCEQNKMHIHSFFDWKDLK